MLRAAQRGTRNGLCHHTNEQENTKSRRKLEEKTFVMTKSARRLEEISTHIECDQDSRFSFDDDQEKNTTSHEDNLEDWTEYVKKKARKKLMKTC